jgi:hypothetical protein
LRVIIDPKNRQCQGCGSKRVRLSHRKPLDLLLSLFLVRPFRCRDCYLRFRGFYIRLVL